MHETVDPSVLPECQIFSCPVCGGKLSCHLPTIEDILKDEFTFTEDFCIADSVILVACDFFHERDEDDGNFPLIVPHPLTAVIKMEFDSAGECTEFEILDVCTPDSLGDSLRVNDVKEVNI